MTSQQSSIDPYCVHHGKRWSEHEGGRCLYCCVCFKTLTPDQCAEDAQGQKWDMCVECGGEQFDKGGTP